MARMAVPDCESAAPSRVASSRQGDLPRRLHAEAVATIADVHTVIDPAVAIINLSDAVDPQTTWDV
jgi:hypothetical protein